MRDFQRSKVYRWERVALPNFDSSDYRLAFSECEALISSIWRRHAPLSLYGGGPDATIAERIVRQPWLTDGRGTSWARGSRTRINLPQWARTPAIICHEVAHALPYPGDRHGPLFMRIFLELVTRHDPCSKGRVTRSLVESARAAGIKVAPHTALRRAGLRGL